MSYLCDCGNPKCSRHEEMCFECLHKYLKYWQFDIKDINKKRFFRYGLPSILSYIFLIAMCIVTFIFNYLNISITEIINNIFTFVFLAICIYLYISGCMLMINFAHEVGDPSIQITKVTVREKFFGGYDVSSEDGGRDFSLGQLCKTFFNFILGIIGAIIIAPFGCLISFVTAIKVKKCNKDIEKQLYYAKQISDGYAFISYRDCAPSKINYEDIKQFGYLVLGKYCNSAETNDYYFIVQYNFTRDKLIFTIIYKKSDTNSNNTNMCFESEYFNDFLSKREDELYEEKSFPNLLDAYRYYQNLDNETKEKITKTLKNRRGDGRDMDSLKINSISNSTILDNNIKTSNIGVGKNENAIEKNGSSSMPTGDNKDIEKFRKKINFIFFILSVILFASVSICLFAFDYVDMSIVKFSLIDYLKFSVARLELIIDPSALGEISNSTDVLQELINAELIIILFNFLFLLSLAIKLILSFFKTLYYYLKGTAVKDEFYSFKTRGLGIAAQAFILYTQLKGKCLLLIVILLLTYAIIQNIITVYKYKVLSKNKELLLKKPRLARVFDVFEIFSICVFVFIILMIGFSNTLNLSTTLLNFNFENFSVSITESLNKICESLIALKMPSIVTYLDIIFLVINIAIIATILVNSILYLAVKFSSRYIKTPYNPGFWATLLVWLLFTACLLLFGILIFVKFYNGFSPYLYDEVLLILKIIKENFPYLVSGLAIIFFWLLAKMTLMFAKK